MRVFFLPAVVLAVVRRAEVMEDQATAARELFFPNPFSWGSKSECKTVCMHCGEGRPSFLVLRADSSRRRESKPSPKHDCRDITFESDAAVFFHMNSMYAHSGKEEANQTLGAQAGQSLTKLDQCWAKLGSFWANVGSFTHCDMVAF